MSLLELYSIGIEMEGRVILKDINFSQQKFQKLALAGVTGSGKTTLLKVVAGLIQPSEGEVLFDGRRVMGPDEKMIAGYKFIAYLSQHFELPNHYRVEELLEMSNQLHDDAIALISQVCRIDHLLKRRTNQLSGGEKQRIALARILISAPQLLLLDEPFSNLDAAHKNLLKLVIDDISELLGITSLLVSHDPADVLSWANQIIVLQNGQIVQQGSPSSVYKTPVNEYAAGLFGKYSLMSPSLAKSLSFFADIDMNRINAFFRPEEFKISSQPGSGVKGIVNKVRFMGSYAELEINISGNNIIANDYNCTINKSDEVYVSLAE